MAKQEFTDAIALLKADHREVLDLFEKFESAKSNKQKIATQICNELKIHSQIEEEIFYPALEGKIEEDTIKEAYVEHDGAKVLINDILSGNPEDEFYESKVKVLGEEIEHHIKEEEAGKEGMFAQARKTDVDLKALGEQLYARKEELLARLKANGELPPAQTTAVNPDA